MIETQLAPGYASSRGFREALLQIMGAASTKLGDNAILKFSWLNTPLGAMLAVANEEGLCLLEFFDRRGLEAEIARLRQKTNSVIISGCSPWIDSIEKELELYFKGELKVFQTPLCSLGSPFQKHVWRELLNIPFGETKSYAELALALKKPSAFRAAALANGANQFAIAIPCHRVINKNGKLGGYAGGLIRKAWLLGHERKVLGS